MKTEALIGKSIKDRKDIVYYLCNMIITPSRSVKYLGVRLGTFGRHIKEVLK